MKVNLQNKLLALSDVSKLLRWVNNIVHRINPISKTYQVHHATEQQFWETLKHSPHFKIKGSPVVNHHTLKRFTHLKSKGKPQFNRFTTPVGTLAAAAMMMLLVIEAGADKNDVGWWRFWYLILIFILTFLNCVAGECPESGLLMMIFWYR